MNKGTYCQVRFSSNRVTQSAAALNRTHTLSTRETGIMRPSVEWKVTTIGRRHILPATTLRAQEVVKFHRGLSIRTIKINGSTLDIRNDTVRGRTVSI